MTPSFLIPNRCLLIGMVHLLPLPGSPSWDGRPLQSTLDLAMRDADALIRNGCDALLVENMGDLPYLRGSVPPEITAAMTLATAQIRTLNHPTGVQILAAANHEALAVAYAAGAQFIRAEAFAYSHVADEGWLDACAGPLLRTRRNLNAQHIHIWADIKKKHAAHAVTDDVPLLDTALGTAFCGADALIVTGTATGSATSLSDVTTARKAGLPVAVGSGITPQNAASFAPHADAVIVGSYLKYNGIWRNPVDPQRVRLLREALDLAAS